MHNNTTYTHTHVNVSTLPGLGKKIKFNPVYMHSWTLLKYLVKNMI